MSKIQEAINEIHRIDNKTYDNSFFIKIHPLIKFLITIIYIVFLTSINKYDLITTVSMVIYLIVVGIIGDISIKNCIKKFKVIFILLFFIGIANPILDRTIVTYIGIIPITSGVISMITLFLKGFFAIIASYLLITTTSIDDLCYALKLLHIPNTLIVIFMLIYRYIMVFLKEVERIWTAYSLRAPKQKGVNFKVWGSMIGSLLIRSMDRAQIVYESMELRGFNPDKFFIRTQQINTISIIYFIAMIILLVLIRFVPIFEIVGSAFV